ncbi:MAG: polyprenol monophosphomannose synthase [Saprospiraceae bacterium]|nr:polyprenol monophosphomannose synthase [Saprospiraceae bacterium]
MSDSIVIIPTYNEKENIEAIIRAVFDLEKDFDILVVDDDSPDGTADIVRELQGVFPGRLHLLSRKGKQGLGTAYIAGFNWGLDRDYGYFFEMDADFSHNPEDLVRLYNACNKGLADVAIGSRYIKGGGVKNWPWDRLWLSYGASLYVRLITGMNVKDPTAGFKCYRRKVLENIDFSKIKFIGYAFQIEMKFAAHTLGFRIAEVPITFVDRELGTSKMSSNIITEAVLGVLKMKWNSFTNSYQAESP